MDYSKVSTKALIRRLTVRFNKFIRERDSFNGDGKSGSCITCGHPVSGAQWQAGHFYPAGITKSLKFDEDNVHGQCKKCNYYLSGNLTIYEQRLIDKIGERAVARLHFMAAVEKQRSHYEWDRTVLIEKLNKY